MTNPGNTKREEMILSGINTLKLLKASITEEKKVECKEKKISFSYN